MVALDVGKAAPPVALLGASEAVPAEATSIGTPSTSVAEPQLRAGREDDGALDDVLELADVPRPRVGDRAAASPRAGTRVIAPADLRRVATDEVVDQQRDVLARARAAAAARSGRRSAGSRGPARNLPSATACAQVAVGGRDDAHVDRDRAGCRRRARTRCSWRTRSSFAWISSGSSPISSRKSVPPSASSKRPDAPLAWRR